MDRNYPRVNQSTLHYMAYKIDPRSKTKEKTDYTGSSRYHGWTDRSLMNQRWGEEMKDHVHELDLDLVCLCHG